MKLYQYVYITIVPFIYIYIYLYLFTHVYLVTCELVSVVFGILWRDANFNFPCGTSSLFVLHSDTFEFNVRNSGQDTGHGYLFLAHVGNTITFAVHNGSNCEINVGVKLGSANLKFSPIVKEHW